MAITEISAAFDDPTGRTGHVLGTKLLDANGICRTVTGTANPVADISYRDYYGPLDHVMQAVEGGPVGVVRTGTELIAPHTGCAFYADWVRPNDLEEGLFVRLTGHAKPTSFVVAGSKRSQSFDSADRVTLMAELVPHLQQALRAHDRLSVLTRRNGDLADALNIAAARDHRRRHRAAHPRMQRRGREPVDRWTGTADEHRVPGRVGPTRSATAAATRARRRCRRRIRRA